MLTLSRVAEPALLTGDARSVSKTVARSGHQVIDWSSWKDSRCQPRQGSWRGWGARIPGVCQAAERACPRPDTGSFGSSLITVYPY